MYVKKIKRKCSVRACKNTETFMISRSREVGNSVIICEDCLREALEAVTNYKDKKKEAASASEAYKEPAAAQKEIPKTNNKAAKKKGE